MKYCIGYNMPGYMPDNEPSECDDLSMAWEYLIQDLLNFFSECLDNAGFELTDTYTQMKKTLKDLEDATPQECNVYFGDYVYWITKG